MKQQHFVRLLVVAVSLLALVLCIPWTAFADFIPTTGSSADLVLGQVDFFSNSSATTKTGMNEPGAVAVDPISRKVFVADRNNHRVLRFASVTALVDGVAAEGVLGQADFNHGLANRGGAVAANTMNSPFGVHVDSAGRLWVADDFNHRVLRFDNAATKANGANADGVLGQLDFNHDGFATTKSGMNTPTHVFVTQDGQLWVAEYGNNRVLRFDNAASKANGSDADGVLGQPNFTTNTSATTKNGMMGPVAVFVDFSGRLWVADHENHRVLRFDAVGSKPDGANADGVLGQVDFTSKAISCTQSSMNYPRGVSGDFDGRLYVSDGNNNRVLVFLHAAGLSYGANADLVLGQTDFTTCTPNTGGISASTLYRPSRIFYDLPTRVLWVADRLNHRVLMYGVLKFSVYLPVMKN